MACRPLSLSWCRCPGLCAPCLLDGWSLSCGVLVLAGLRWSCRFCLVVRSGPVFACLPSPVFAACSPRSCSRCVSVDRCAPLPSRGAVLWCLSCHCGGLPSLLLVVQGLVLLVPLASLLPPVSTLAVASVCFRPVNCVVWWFCAGSLSASLPFALACTLCGLLPGAGWAAGSSCLGGLLGFGPGFLVPFCVCCADCGCFLGLRPFIPDSSCSCLLSGVGWGRAWLVPGRGCCAPWSFFPCSCPPLVRAGPWGFCACAVCLASARVSATSLDWLVWGVCFPSLGVGGFGVVAVGPDQPLPCL